jgi:lipoprotein-releasing system ATP-binding protein
MPLLTVRQLFKSYFLHGKRIDVLRGVTLDIEQGELVSLVGASGSGKSTLLHVLGTLDAPAAGQIVFQGVSVLEMSEAAIADFRNRTIGFVFQSHYLLPEFTALENVAMPALIQRRDRAEAMRGARELLERVELGARIDHRPGELSGGEAQRVALARALVLQPALLLADEPTGNLDPATGEGIHRLLREVNRDLGITAIIVTHNEALAQSMPRRLRLMGGQVLPA